MEYKYSKLVLSAATKEGEVPAADSCAIMEGEDAEDELLFPAKKSLFGKIKSLATKVSGGHRPGGASVSPSPPGGVDVEQGGGGGSLMPGSPQRTSDGFDSVPLKTSSSSANLEL